LCARILACLAVEAANRVNRDEAEMARLLNASHTLTQLSDGGAHLRRRTIGRTNTPKSRFVLLSYGRHPEESLS